MKRKELMEIKKQFTPGNCAITRIAGFYVNDEKEVTAEFTTPFLSLPEEEMFKYFDMYRKALSGAIGKNMFALEFAESAAGGKMFLKSLRDSKLTERNGLEILIENIIDMYDHTGNYFVTIIHAAYDIPGKAADGEEMFDASEDVFDYIMCCICPVGLSAAGLAYNPDSGRIEQRKRDWVVELPDTAFMYPAFTDRSTDYDHVWYYQHDKDHIQGNMIENVLNCKLPVSVEIQQEILNEVLKSTIDGKCGIEGAKIFFKQVSEFAEQQDYGEKIDTKILGKMLVSAGAETESVREALDGKEDKISQVQLNRIVDTKKFRVQTESADIRIDSERTDIVQSAVEDGARYIKIKVDGNMFANGIQIW